MHSGVLSSAVDGSPHVCQRYCVPSRGFTLPLTAICTLLHGHAEACVLFPVSGKCSEPVRFPRLLLALGIGPQGGPNPFQDRGPRWNLRLKLDWIFRVKLTLPLAQASALPGIARRL